MQQKKCLVCKKVYFNRNYVRQIQWNKSKFCSVECRKFAQSILKISNKPKKDMPSKICCICGVTFLKDRSYSYEQWDKRIVCSMKCLNVWDRQNNIGFKKGHCGYINSGNFKIGQHPWNKDVHIKFNDALDRYRKLNNNVSIFKGKKHRTESIQKIKDARARQVFPKGKDHWNYKGGISPFRTVLQNTYAYKKWRMDVFKRDNFTCQKCGISKVFLNVDHIKPFCVIKKEHNIKTIEDAMKCPELWNVSNGLTLCVSCHRKTDTYGSKSFKLLK